MYSSAILRSEIWSFILILYLSFVYFIVFTFTLWELISPSRHPSQRDPYPLAGPQQTGLGLGDPSWSAFLAP